MNTRNHWVHALAIQRGLMVKEIEGALKRARGVIVESSIAHVQSMLDESLRLFLAGETLASMWAGQAALEAAASLSYALDDHPLHRARWARVAGGKKGAERRKSENNGGDKRAAVIAAIKKYKGDPRGMAAAIARRVPCSERYVRDIKTELSLP